MTESKEKQIFSVLLQQASRVVDIASLYIALYDRRRARITFPLIARERDGNLEEEEQCWAPHGFRPDCFFPDSIFSDGSTLLLENGVENWFEDENLIYSAGDRVADLISEWERCGSADDSGKVTISECPEIKPHIRLPKSLLAVPLVARGNVLAVIVLEDYARVGAYDEEDQRIMLVMANHVAATLTNLRHVERLRVINQVGQALNSQVRRGVDEILDLVYRQAGHVMDTRNMYVALYDEATRLLTFPLAYYNGKREQNWPSREVDPERGLTDRVILNEKPLCPPNVEDWYTDNNIEPAILPVPKSWVGVPLVREGQVLGVIALQNDYVANLYSQDDIDVLKTMADQVAIALDNARLYAHMEDLVRQRTQRLEEVQREALAAERLAAVNDVAGELVHKMNNLAGTIPARVRLAKEQLDPKDDRDTRIGKTLDGIFADSVHLLEEAKKIRESTSYEIPVRIDANEMLQIALNRIRNSLNIELESIDVLEDFYPDPLYVAAPRNSFISSLENIVRNAVESMPNGGVLRLGTVYLRAQSLVEIFISDTGDGIAPVELPKIFDPFYSTKPGSMGFGLWQAKNLIRSVRGDIDVESTVGEGTVFRLRVPIYDRVE